VKRFRSLACWPVAIAALVTAFWTARVVLPGDARSLEIADLLYYFYPVYDAAYGWLAAGKLPLWNPYELCGIPWLADPAGGFFYPPHALYLVLPTHLALAASGLLHLIWIGLSTALLTRRMGLGAAPATLAAILFAMRGTLPGELSLAPCRLEAAAWLPLGCIAVLDLASGVERGRAREALRAGALLALAVAASCLAGYPQVTVLLGYAWGALLLAQLFAARAPLAGWLASSAVFGGALALGALVSLVQLLPSFELSRAATRTTEQMSVAMMYPMGNPTLAILAGAISGARRSFGVVGLSLLPAALLARPNRPLALWALALGALAFGFALGPITPVFDLYLVLPVLSWFRGPYRLLLLADFCFAVLAALGLAAIGAAAAAPRRGPRLVATLGLPALLALALAVQQGSNGRARYAALAGCVAGVLLTGLLWPASRRASLVAISLLVLATAEVFLAPPNRLRLPYDAAAATEYRIDAEVFTKLAEVAAHDRVWQLRSGALAPHHAEKISSLYGFRAFTSKTSANLARQASYHTYLAEGSTRTLYPGYFFQGEVPLDGTQAGYAPVAARRRLIDLAAVRFVVVTRADLPRAEVRDFLREARLLEAALGSDDLAIFENPHALPRAYVVYRVRPAPPAEELLARLSNPAFDPLVESYIEGDPPPGVASGTPPRGRTASLVSDDARVVEIEADLDAAGFVVLADSYYEGWQATVDGAPAPIYPTNHLFRGVPVPAGRHRVRFEYRPWSFTVGAAGSLVALLALGILFYRTRGSGPYPAATTL
jgi:hypothetical protein